MRGCSIEDTIAALSTPIGEGGIGIVRLSGREALKIADEIFVSKDHKKPSQFRTYTTHYGYIVDRKKTTNDIIDEVILTVMRRPKSYTREDTVEINCHGGIQAAKNVLDLVLGHGSRIAEPGEFTKRAFLNGRIDLVQAEAVSDVIRARTEAALKTAMNQLGGELSKKVNDIRDKIIEMAAHIETSIDFPEEDAEIMNEAAVVEKTRDILNSLKALIETSKNGMILREGVLAVICGKPNAGKSSLMNLLLKRDRVIVTPIPGTTRDAVEEMINLKGLGIRLVDTAGITATEDLLEKEGVARSKRYLELADIVILMLDGSVPLDPRDLDIIRLIQGKKKIVAINKSDLPKRLEMKAVREAISGGRIFDISVKDRMNIDGLENGILETVWNGDFTQAEPAVVTNARHRDLLERTFMNMSSVDDALSRSSAPELITVDLKEAIFNLGLIVGKSVSEDILDRIFENFCIGK